MTDNKKTMRPPSDATDDTLFDALSVERWSQETFLGTSVATEVMDKIEGTITTTERRFVSVDGGGELRAHLVRTVNKLPSSDDS